MEVAGTSAVLEPIRVLLTAFRKASRPIVHVVRLYEADGGNVDLCRRRSVEDGARMLVSASQGSQLARQLLPAPDLVLDHELLLAGKVQGLGSQEAVIYKPRWGAFYNTPLESHLREQEVTTLVICGCNFPNCPRTSIYEASERDFRIVLVRDAISGLYERGESRAQKHRGSADECDRGRGRNRCTQRLVTQFATAEFDPLGILLVFPRGRWIQQGPQGGCLSFTRIAGRRRLPPGPQRWPVWRHRREASARVASGFDRAREGQP